MRSGLALQIFAPSSPYKCEKVAPSNGIGRVSCGFVFNTGFGPGKMGSTREESGHWENVGHGALVNDDPRGRNYTNNPFPFTANPITAGSTCEAISLQSQRFPFITGYIQTAMSYEHADIFPSVYVVDPGGAPAGYLAMAYDHLAGGPGQTVCRMYGTFPASGAGQVMNDTGRTTFACEIRPGDKAVRMWSDPGLDPRVTGGGLWTGGNLPMRIFAKVANGVNGFKGRGGISEILVNKARAIALNVPAALSARVSVNGVVQPFGAFGYLAMPGGVGSFDPDPGVWWPSLVRYEFFSGAALGGIIVSDVTVAKAWGGDVMGPV